uniref:Uncharacterized protein n=1 Tax=Rhizophora mucronata TaxID=61149 RepID=A0A2P2PB53_RHIMU
MGSQMRERARIVWQPGKVEGENELQWQSDRE